MRLINLTPSTELQLVRDLIEEFEKDFNLSEDLLSYELESGGAVMYEAEGATIVVVMPDSSSQFVWMMLVPPNKRGQGLGRALMDEVLRLHGKYPMRLTCKPELESYYKKIGFVKVDGCDEIIEMVWGEL